MKTNMTPKEKANQLVNVYYNGIMSFLTNNMKLENAKKCALIAVDEIMEFMKMDDEYTETLSNANSKWVHYWIEVKQEIKNI
jgi:hypothetical protein